MRDDRPGVPTTQEEAAQARGHAGRIGPAQRRQAPAGRRPCPRELRLREDGRQRRVDERRGDAARAKLGGETRRTVAAGRAGFDPLAREGTVVHVAARGEVDDHGGGHVVRRTATLEAPGELAAGPRPPREEVGRRAARGGGVEATLGRYDRLKKALAALLRGIISGGFSSFFCSNDCSPVEKMPRTLRSKSSGLDAASRAVS